jgi:hypothetical protein
VPFTRRNIKEDLEDVGSRFDGAPDLEFRAATRWSTSRNGTQSGPARRVARL